MMVRMFFDNYICCKFDLWSSY